MKKSKRVSQEDLDVTIATAVATETKRIEQLNAQAIDQISGGSSMTTNPPPGQTVGYFPPPTEGTENV